MARGPVGRFFRGAEPPPITFSPEGAEQIKALTLARFEHPSEMHILDLSSITKVEDRNKLIQLLRREHGKDYVFKHNPLSPDWHYRVQAGEKDILTTLSTKSVGAAVPVPPPAPPTPPVARPPAPPALPEAAAPEFPWAEEISPAKRRSRISRFFKKETPAETLDIENAGLERAQAEHTAAQAEYEKLKKQAADVERTEKVGTEGEKVVNHELKGGLAYDVRAKQKLVDAAKEEVEKLKDTPGDALKQAQKQLLAAEDDLLKTKGRLTAQAQKIAVAKQRVNALEREVRVAEHHVGRAQKTILGDAVKVPEMPPEFRTTSGAPIDIKTGKRLIGVDGEQIADSGLDPRKRLEAKQAALAERAGDIGQSRAKVEQAAKTVNAVDTGPKSKLTQATQVRDTAQRTVDKYSETITRMREQRTAALTRLETADTALTKIFESGVAHAVKEGERAKRQVIKTQVDQEVGRLDGEIARLTKLQTRAQSTLDTAKKKLARVARSANAATTVVEETHEAVTNDRYSNATGRANAEAEFKARATEVHTPTPSATPHAPTTHTPTTPTAAAGSRAAGGTLHYTGGSERGLWTRTKEFFKRPRNSMIVDGAMATPGFMARKAVGGVGNVVRGGSGLIRHTGYAAIAGVAGVTALSMLAGTGARQGAASLAEGGSLPGGDRTPFANGETQIGRIEVTPAEQRTPVELGQGNGEWLNRLLAGEEAPGMGGGLPPRR